MFLAIIAMTKNGTFTLNETEQATMLASYFYGYTSLMVISGSLIVKFGAKLLLCGGTVFAGVATLMFPTVASTSFMGACLLRFATGLLHASVMPGQRSISIPWVPHHESARFFYFQGSGCLVGSLVSFYGSAQLIAQYGWESVFYVNGIVSVVSGLIYWFLVTITPEESKFVSTEELHFIQANRLQFAPPKTKSIPYVKLLTSAPLWSVYIAFSTSAILHTFFAQLMPKYLSDNLNVELSQAGKLTAIPTGVEFFAALIVTFCADSALVHGVKVKSVRRVIMTIAQLVPGVLCLVMTQLRSLTWIMIVATAALSVCGIQPSGAFLNINELCPPYAAAAFALANTVGSVVGMVMMQGMGLLFDRFGNTNATWAWVFVLMGVLNLIGACFSWALTEGETQSWAKSSDFENEENEPCSSSRKDSSIHVK